MNTNIPLTRGTSNSAGHDLVSPDCYIIAPGKSVIIDTGVKIYIKEGYYCKIEGRSSLGIKNIVPFNGTIDSDYPNTIKVILENKSDVNYVVQSGDRIAQLILLKYEVFDNAVVLSNEPHTGFGSTGK